MFQLLHSIIQPNCVCVCLSYRSHTRRINRVSIRQSPWFKALIPPSRPDQSNERLEASRFPPQTDGRSKQSPTSTIYHLPTSAAGGHRASSAHRPKRCRWPAHAHCGPWRRLLFRIQTNRSPVVALTDNSHAPRRPCRGVLAGRRPRCRSLRPSFTGF